MEELKKQELVDMVGKMLLKTQEILAMMKQGQFITAYEKLGGVQKNLSYLGSIMQKDLAPQNLETKAE